MSESLKSGGDSSVEIKNKEMAREIFVLTQEMIGQRFKFPGISDAELSRLRTEERDLPEGYFVPIDRTIDKFNTQGMKFVFGKNPGSGTVFVVPAESDPAKAIDDFEFVLPHTLNKKDLPEEVRKIVELDQQIKDNNSFK